MVFQLDFKDTYHNIRMYLGIVLVLFDLYSLFLHSSHFSAQKSEALLFYFGLKNPLFTFSECDFSALKF